MSIFIALFLLSFTVKSHYIEDVLNQTDDTSANNLLIANLKEKNDDLSNIDQDTTQQFYEKGFLNTLRTMMKNNAFFDVREIIYKDYLEAMQKTKADIPDWSFHAIPSKPSFSYILNNDLNSHINSILELISGNKNSEIVKHDWSSLNPVFVLKNTEEFPLMENGVLKIVTTNNRLNALKNTHIQIRALTLNKLVAPRYADGDGYIFEEKIDTDANFYFQQSLYNFLYQKSKNNPKLKEQIITALSQLTKVVCRTNYNDIKYDNNPITKNGLIALIDAEASGHGNGPMRLLEEDSEFFTPSFAKDDIQKVITEHQNRPKSQCNEDKYNISNIDLSKIKEDAYLKEKSFEDGIFCQIKKGIIDKSEDVYDKEQLKKDFPKEEDYTVASSLLNNLKANDPTGLRFVQKGYNFMKPQIVPYPYSERNENIYVLIFNQLIDKKYICSLTGFDPKKASINSDIRNAKNIMY